MRDRTKIAIWGVGRQARKRILPAVMKAESVGLVGLYTLEPAEGKEEADRRGCSHYLSSEEMLSDPRVEAVILCTPTGLHYSQGMSVLQAGKHLWCEKSFATCYSHARQLVELARDKHLFVGEAYMYKYHQQFKRLKEAVRDSELGRLKRLICRFSLPVLEEPGFRTIPDLGASALLDVGGYTFSVAAELFDGDPRIELAEYRVGAHGIDQAGFCVVGYEDGSKAVLDWSYDSCYVNQAELWFEKGTIFTDKIFSKDDDYRPVLQMRSLKGNMMTEEVGAENCYVTMLEHFARCSASPGPDDSIDILRTAQLVSAFAENVGMPDIGWR